MSGSPGSLGGSRVLAYAAGNFPAGLLLLVIQTWLMRLYCPSPDEIGRTLYVSPETYGLVFFLISIPSAIADPLVGHWSDRTRSRLGRRMPYILYGTPVLVLSFFLLWFPPVAGEAVENTIWLSTLLCLVYLAFTVVVNPYLALMPEVWTQEDDRVRVSAWMSGFNAVAQVFAFVALGMLIAGFDGGIEIAGFDFADGYKVGAGIAALLSAVALVPTLLWIRETPHGSHKEVPFGLFASAWKTLKNPAFLPYIVAGSLIGAAQFVVVATIPFLMKVVIGEDEDGAGYVLLMLVVLSALCLPLVGMLARRFSKKTLFLASLVGFAVVLPFTTLGGKLGFVEPLWWLIGSCVLIAPFLAISLVIPRAILADVMDHDTTLTGFRREAMYNGMEGLVQKLAGGLAPLAQGALFAGFGYTAEAPWGILLCGAAGGLLALAAILAFSFYPLKK